jgi:hypothetical protein
MTPSATEDLVADAAPEPSSRTCPRACGIHDMVRVTHSDIESPDAPQERFLRTRS